MLLTLAGCTARADAGGEAAVLEPPYRVDPDSPSRLLVRADLAALLESTPVTSSAAQTKVVGYGRVQFASDAAYAVRAPFASYVERVLVGPGDRVTAKQALAELRSSDVAQLRAHLVQAEVHVQLERQALARLRPLVEDGTGTQRELTEAQARVHVAEAELSSARQALSALGPTGGKGERYLLRAGAEGSIIRRNVSAGERVGPEDDAAFIIGDPKHLVVRASFPERDAPWLEQGARCSFTVQATRSERLEGTITRVLSAVNHRTRSVEAICTPDKQSAGLSAEMAARVEAQVRGDGGLLLPRSALLMKRDEWVVFVRQGDNTLERRTVRPGKNFGSSVQILEGVAIGEQVVVEGAVLLDGELDVLL
jgi:membrane fusion protein, heavy metal efflux system